VDKISAIIAAAIEEQGAATQEIARNVSQAAAQPEVLRAEVDRFLASIRAA
jgi:methyl-accepting chemotaxis protein